MKRTALKLSLFLLLAVPLVSSAAGLVPCGGPPPEQPCDFNALIQLANNIIKFLITAGVALAAVAISWAGWLVLTSGDNPGKRSDAIKIIWKVFWGLVMMLAAWLIVELVLRSLGYRGEGLNFIRDLAP